MDSTTLLLLFTAASVVAVFVFGTQYRGLWNWLRSRRKTQPSAPSVVIAPDPSTAASGASTTATSNLPPAPPAPIAQPVAPSEPKYLVVSRVLAQQGQPKASKWACYLPQIFNAASGICYVLATCVGIGSLYAGIYVSFHANWLWTVTSAFWMLSICCFGLAWATPILILQGANIAWLVHRLRTE